MCFMKDLGNLPFTDNLDTSIGTCIRKCLVGEVRIVGNVTIYRVHSKWVCIH